MITFSAPTPAQTAILQIRIEKVKEMGAMESELILEAMLFVDSKTYEQILDSPISYYFNELCKKAIAFDKINQ